jgi:pSer/pThr/pTyr-binding forkhead associated (FHA) protein
MPKLILQYDGLVLKEFPVGQVVTIGRLPGNSIVIDNPAVSSKHARIVRDGDSYVIEDAESTNGTFVNELRVTKQPLSYGDLVLIGKHHLVFQEGADEDTAPPAEPAREVADLGGTVYLDTKRQKELLAQARAKHAAVPAAAAVTVAAGSHAAPAPRVAAPPAPAPETARMAKAPSAPAPSPTTVGVLYVLAGKTDQTEYPLKAQTCLIGKSDSATVRLKGWFKPKTALAIARKGNGYTATPLGGKNSINNQPFSGRQDLHDGDVLQVSGVTLEFRLME